MKITKATSLILLALGLTSLNSQANPLYPTKDLNTQVELNYLNPLNLKQMVLNGNLDLMQAYARVKQAGDRVQRARLDLLPAINLSAVVAGPAGFAGQFATTLPFLLPNNWLRLSAIRNLRDAEEAGLKSLALNTLHIAEKSYYLTVHDEELLKIFKNYKADILSLGHYYEEYNAQFKRLDPVGLNLIRGKSQLIDADLTQTSELLTFEKAAINQMLAKRADYSIVPEHLTAHPLEKLSSQQIMERLKNSETPSPEMLQINKLIEGSKSTKWANVFSFFNGASVGTNSGKTFGNISESGTANIGFGLIALYSLGNHQVEEFEYQKQQLIEGAWYIIETTKANIDSAKQQVDLYEQAALNYRENFELLTERMKEGRNDLVLPLGALQQAVDANIQVLNSKLQLDQARLKLHRLFQTDLFKNVNFKIKSI